MIDSHCHLADETFAADLDLVVGRAKAAGLERALVILEAVRSLDLDDRLALIASRYLGWDEATIGRALGMLPAAAGRRSRVATARVLAVVEAAEPGVVDRAFAVAGAATLTGLTSTAFAAGNDTIKVGLIGCGGRGTGAVRNILEAEAKINGDNPKLEIVAVGATLVMVIVEMARSIRPELVAAKSA